MYPAAGYRVRPLPPHGETENCRFRAQYAATAVRADVPLEIARGIIEGIESPIPVIGPRYVDCGRRQIQDRSGNSGEYELTTGRGCTALKRAVIVADIDGGQIVGAKIPRGVLNEKPLPCP